MAKKRVLVVKLGALGDIVFASELPAYLKSCLPDIYIDWLVSQKLASVVKMIQHVETIHAIDDSGMKGSFIRKLQFLAALRKVSAGYDAILLLHRSRSFAYAFLGRGPIFQLTRSTKILYPGHVPVLVPPMNRNEAFAYRDVADRFLDAHGRQFSLSKSWKIPRDASPSKGDIVIHVGGGENAHTDFRLKQWPHTMELIRRLDGPVTLVGSESDRDANALELAALTTLSSIRNLVGATSLQSLFQVIAGAKAFIGPDSGPLHIADSLGIPSLGLFGPTSPISWGVTGSRSLALFHSVPCQPCYRDDSYFPPCPHHHICMQHLKVDSVLAAFQNLKLQ